MSNCSICFRSISVTAAGLIRCHGPVGNRCLGSGKSRKQLNAVLSPPSPVSNKDSTPLPRACPTTSSASVVACEFIESILAVRVLERIPKAARHQCRLKLTTILEAVVRGASVDAWKRLFRFSMSCLRVPARLRNRVSVSLAMQ